MQSDQHIYLVTLSILSSLCHRTMFLPLIYIQRCVYICATRIDISGTHDTEKRTISHILRIEIHLIQMVLLPIINTIINHPTVVAARPHSQGHQINFIRK